MTGTTGEPARTPNGAALGGCSWARVQLSLPQHPASPCGVGEQGTSQASLAPCFICIVSSQLMIRGFKKAERLFKGDFGAPVCRASQSTIGPHPRTPSHPTSPRSRSPRRTSTGWGCSAHSHTGTGSTGSSSGPLLGFLMRRGEPREPECHLSSLQHSRGMGTPAQRASPQHPPCMTVGPLFLSSIPIPPSPPWPGVTTPVSACWVLHGRTAPTISEPGLTAKLIQSMAGREKQTLLL